MIKKIALIAAVILASLAHAWAAAAQPVVKSVTQTTTQIIISGSAFGTRPDFGGSEAFLNRAWRNFDGESSLTASATIGG